MKKMYTVELTCISDDYVKRVKASSPEEALEIAKPIILAVRPKNDTAIRWSVYWSHSRRYRLGRIFSA